MEKAREINPLSGAPSARRNRRPSRALGDVVLWFVVILALLDIHFLSCKTTYGEEPLSSDKRLVLLNEAPLQQVYDLRFSDDSKRLFAGGSDKRVYEWSLLPAQDGGLEIAVERHSLWWEISRHGIGAIRSISISESSREIAIGGSSARGYGGDIAVLDLRSGKTNRLLPVAPRDLQFARGHRWEVCSVAFSPQGHRVLSTDLTGEVRVWSAASGWTSQVLSEIDGLKDERRKVAFLSNDRAIFTRLVPESQRRWLNGQVFVADVSAVNPMARALPQKHIGGILGLAVDQTNGRWASSDGVGHVYVWEGDRQSGSIDLAQGAKVARVAAAMAFDEPGRLMVNAVAPTSAGSFRTDLEIWDVVRRRRLDSVPVGEGRPGLTVAMSPDGRLGACTEGDSNAIRLYQLDGNGRFERQPDGTPRYHKMTSSKEAILKVAFADDDSLRIGYGCGAAATVDKAFDLVNQRPLGRLPAGVRFRIHGDDAGGWTLVPGDLDQVTRRQTLSLRLRRRERCRIELDTGRQGSVAGKLASWCWISDELGRPQAVAVGTDRYNIFVYQLVDAGVCPLLRYYRDHTDSVTSLSVTRDGKYLASGAMDGMIKIWSLDGLQKTDGSFAQQIAWGVDLVVEHGQAVVTRLNKAGIAACRGLQDGDVIQACEKTTGEQIKRYEGPQAIVSALENAEFWDQIKLYVSRNGKEPIPIRLVPGWEPLVSLFVDAKNEWAVWTPAGYYNASVNGDHFFGWLVNGEQRGDTPRFFQAKQFREDLERPEVIRNLFALGNLPDALQQRGLNSQGDVVKKAVRQLPIVSILEPRNGITAREGEEVKLVAQVKYPAGLEGYEIVALANGADLGSPRVDRLQGANQIRYSWTLVPSQRYNRVKVRVYRSGNVAVSRHAEQFICFMAEVGPSMRRVHLVGIGAGKSYPKAIRLEYAANDVDVLIKTVRMKAGDFYTLAAKPDLLLEGSVRRDSVEELFSQILRRLREAESSDLLVVMVGGHGKAYDSEFYLIAPDERALLETRDSQRQVDLLKEIGIPWTVFQQLASLPCQKLFLLDTCQSGAAARAEDGTWSADWKASIRPLEAFDVMVVAAAGADESARGDPETGHGFFTRCLLEALGGNADGYAEVQKSYPADGTVTLGEAIQYVENEVPRLFPFQHPTHSPVGFKDFVDIPLVTASEQP